MGIDKPQRFRCVFWVSMVRWPPSGIASRADSKVQDNVLELIGIGIRPPQAPSKRDFQLNVGTKRMSQKIGHAGNSLLISSGLGWRGC